MKGFRLAYLVLACALGAEAQAADRPASQGCPDFQWCQSTFALCTLAQCKATSDPSSWTCDCTVNFGYSAGQQGCKDPWTESGKQHVKSRYFPITSMLVCHNSAPWAWCLDKDCDIDPTSPAVARCHCSVRDPKYQQDPFIIVTSSPNPSACTPPPGLLISSATVGNVSCITDFVKKQKVQFPFPITVLR